jgi:ferritin-like metal-binding protein YciE
MKLKDLQSLFLYELKDLYSAEKQLTKALPKMARAASNEGLRQTFEHHLKETETQIKRLDDIFKELIEQEAEPQVRDAGLICAAQCVEHYEIAGYGCVHSLAQQLQMNRLAAELQETLDEEKKANEKLNELALSGINEEAMSASHAGSV